MLSAPFERGKPKLQCPIARPFDPNGKDWGARGSVGRPGGVVFDRRKGTVGEVPRSLPAGADAGRYLTRHCRGALAASAGDRSDAGSWISAKRSRRVTEARAGETSPVLAG